LRLEPQLEIDHLSRGQILYETGDVLRFAYFPHNAIVALVNLMEDGSMSACCRARTHRAGINSKAWLPLCFEEMVMVRFYFDFRDGAECSRDDEGFEFDGLEAAVQGAARAAAEIGTGRLGRGDVTVVIEARNERDQRVFTVIASMKIDRHDPQP
jgi:hypothetical protein